MTVELADNQVLNVGDQPAFCNVAWASPDVTANRFAHRVRVFVAGLSVHRRAEIACRPRFRNQPYLRQQNDPTDDFLP